MACVNEVNTKLFAPRTEFSVSNCARRAPHEAGDSGNHMRLQPARFQGGEIVALPVPLVPKNRPPPRFCF